MNVEILESDNKEFYFNPFCSTVRVSNLQGTGSMASEEAFVARMKKAIAVA